MFNALKKISEKVDEFPIFPGVSLADEDALVEELAQSDYDHYVFFQTEDIANRLIDLDLGRFTIIPMYDGAVGRSDAFWQQFLGAQFISFSRTLHEQLTELECNSAYFQYIPPIDPSATERSTINRRDAFFWERRPDSPLNLLLVESLCQQLGVSALHVHLAPDPVEKHIITPPASEPGSSGAAMTYSTSTWFKDHKEYASISGLPLFFFAPRVREGIGMATLEAMSRGQIVVAPDVPTMNEYLSHGVSGILYDIGDPKIETKFSDADLVSISRGAIRKARSVRAEWDHDQDRFESYLSNDGRRWSTPDFSSHFVNKLRRAASARRWG
ncbi:glycosyltransferase [Sphingomonas glacialis]|uniref:glycosyltransferase n=1 Tax=Sphingomonas glacialis TaxID=658225 RepID=UPI001386ECDF|nr:glycosyltransferase [Sphingomonas glacialis]